MKLEYLYNKLFILLFISLLFESISILTIGDFNITAPFIFICLILVVSILRFFLNDNFTLDKSRLVISFLMLLLILISSVLSEKMVSISSAFLYIFYLVYFIVARHTLNSATIEKTIKIFITISTILSIYGIYQFIALNVFTFLPFKELIPESLLAKGYNTNAIAYVGDISLNRAHSIYLEPSTLSQISAITILFIFFSYSAKGAKLKNFVFIVINLLAFVCSLSGTGAILLGIGVLYYAIKKKKILFLILLVVCAFIFIYSISLMLNLDIFSYFISRINELNPKNGNSSGYYRFVLPLIIGFTNMIKHIFGYGCGTDGELLLEYGGQETAIANGYGKIFVELGIIGVLLFFLIIMSLKPRYKSKSDLLSVLFLIVLIYPFLGGSLVQPSFWAYASFLMCNTLPFNKIYDKKSRILSNESFASWK